MGRHDFLVGTLVRTGFRSSLKGFEQFCMCVEMYLDNRAATIESIYRRVAGKCNCSEGAVEKNLRRLFYSSDVKTAVSKLFDMEFDETGNKEIVAIFANYIELERKQYSESV